MNKIQAQQTFYENNVALGIELRCHARTSHGRARRCLHQHVYSVSLIALQACTECSLLHCSAWLLFVSSSAQVVLLYTLGSSALCSHTRWTNPTKTEAEQLLNNDLERKPDRVDIPTEENIPNIT